LLQQLSGVDTDGDGDVPRGSRKGSAEHDNPGCSRPDTNNETGGVSAASQEFADQIGGTFAFDVATGVLTISPPS
jgi:hypothetical protein